MSLADAINQRLQFQIDRLDMAIRDLQAGAVPDLAELQSDVTSLCEEMLKAPGEDSRQVVEKMGEMIGLLEQLARDLKDFQATLTQADAEGKK